LTDNENHYSVASEAFKAYLLGFVISLIMGMICWFIFVGSSTASISEVVDHIRVNGVATFFQFDVQNTLYAAYMYCLLALMIFLVGLMQTVLFALPLAKFLSNGIVKDSTRSWLFYTVVGFLVGVGPWAVLAIATHDPRIYRLEDVVFVFLPQIVIGAATGMALKYRLTKLAAATRIENSIK
jgi:hypothetical protein